MEVQISILWQWEKCWFLVPFLIKLHSQSPTNTFHDPSTRFSLGCFQSSRCARCFLFHLYFRRMGWAILMSLDRHRGTWDNGARWCYLHCQSGHRNPNHINWHPAWLLSFPCSYTLCNKWMLQTQNIKDKAGNWSQSQLSLVPALATCWLYDL